MRARHNRLLTLIHLGRYTESINECEEMLKLCDNDNLGIRYILIGLYCLLEKYGECEKLYKKYNEDSSEMLFVMAIMYFKKGEYKKANKFLKMLDEDNPYILNYLINSESVLEQMMCSDYYQIGTEEESIMIIIGYMYLICSVPMFTTYVELEYKR